ncbi:MAG: cob(I)yrinic acid a,c-diamide adenosyltransferase [Planctomycetota bacterium]
MKIYTKTGDTGTTGLLGGDRVSKDAPRIEAYGAVDELNAALGVALAASPPAGMPELLLRLQHSLFEVGAELAAVDPLAAGTATLVESDIEHLEKVMDELDAELPQLRSFILPGGEPCAAALHQARCVCRRAERTVVTLSHGSPVRPEVLRYLNRVGDLLFVLARKANAAADRPDTPWEKRG